MDFPREVGEIIEFLERIQKNDVRDLEIAKKSRKKYLEISQNAEKFSSSEEFKQFFDAEIENFFQQNMIYSAENKRILENFFQEKYYEIEDFRSKMVFWKQKERVCGFLKNFF